MNPLKRILFLFLFPLLNLQLQAGEATKPLTYANGKLENGIISVTFDLKKGGFSIVDSQSKETLLSDAKFKLPSGQAPANVKVLKVEDVKDEMGVGKRVILVVKDWNLLRYGAFHSHGKDTAQELFSYTLYEKNPALVLGFGLKTPDYISMKIMKSQPLTEGQLFGGKHIEDLKTLNGAAGGEPTLVKSVDSRIAANSLMLTGLVDGKRKTAVWGGLKYNEFAAITTLDKGQIGCFYEDPVGRLIDEGQTYLAKDTFYLDVHTREPFQALERYGRAMRAANHAKPNVYDFPVTCGWSVSNVSKLPDVNNSTKLIGELDYANKCGITRYTDVSLRLEPDKYFGDTEQGWWDDAHMQKFKHLVTPYETTAKWNKAMRAKHGVPYIYMQLGMPSDDFARKFPQYMIFNDASEVDRTASGYQKGSIKHSHNRPYVTFDYTDKEFSKHFVKVWSKLRADGIQGVKVDYPATAWRPEGGFDDRYATCNSAYRRAFQLLRKAFGKDGLIDERNIGESGRPCLDVSAGIVDTQRTWTDSNKFVPAMISRSGLRWYKNRTVFNYYSDTKTVHNHPKDKLQSMLTMNFLTSGRLDLSSSYSLFTPEITRAVSRTYPHYKEAKTARPLDAFTGVKDPQVYDLELTPDWHQLTLYNTGAKTAIISTALSGELVNNALGLNPKEHYHAYDFWSDKYLGKLSGTSLISQKLKPNCCAMISVRKATPYPQVISTDRHILQGWVDLENVNWNSSSKTLSGTANVIGKDVFKIVIANNQAKLLKADVKGAEFKIEPSPVKGLSYLKLSSAKNVKAKWTLQYK